MDRALSRELQFLAVPTAAAVVYMQILGEPPDARAGAGMRETLNDVAHALATLARIYSLDESGAATEIPEAELLQGTFARGAHLFITKDGREYRRLVVQRRDMQAAITILKKANVHWA
jgi:hypothetical protein